MNLLQKFRSEPIAWTISLATIIAIPSYVAGRMNDYFPLSKIVEDVSAINDHPAYECTKDAQFEVYGQTRAYLVVQSSDTYENVTPWPGSSVCAALFSEPYMYVVAARKDSNGEYQPELVAGYTACSPLYNKLETMLNEPRQECPQTITRKRKYPRTL